MVMPSMAGARRAFRVVTATIVQKFRQLHRNLSLVLRNYSIRHGLTARHDLSLAAA